MAKNLIAAGYSLVVYDIAEASVEKLVSAGAERGCSPADVAAKAGEVIITMLPNSPQ
ncbi:MAG: NAD(P)-binding domain-containing protein, partial [Cloacibacillus porcorum]|nr:NAD(P)-binding domain-containing protein [Cloacibacillus porcorum]